MLHYCQQCKGRKASLLYIQTSFDSNEKEIKNLKIALLEKSLHSRLSYCMHFAKEESLLLLPLRLRLRLRLLLLAIPVEMQPKTYV